VLGLELKRPGLLGAKWRISYEAVLVDYGSQIQIIQADGRRIDFQRGTGNQAALCTASQPADGQVRIEVSSTDARQRSYHWRWPDGRMLSFSSVAGMPSSAGYPLHSITAASGQQLSLSYSPSGDLMQVRDPQGRKLSFIYAGAAEMNAGQRGRALKAIDTPLGRITYLQDSIGRLTEVGMVQAAQDDKAAVAHPISTKVYHYEDERNAGFKTSLTGISLRTSTPGQPPVEQRLSTYVYNTQGMAVLSTKGLPLEMKDGRAVAGTGIEQVQLDYVAKALPMEGRPNALGHAVPRQLGKTVLTNSLGAKTEILSAVIAGHYRLIEMRGAGCATCGPTNRRYTYNAAGQLVKETQLDDLGREGDSQLTQFDAQGRVSRSGTQTVGSKGSAPTVLWHTRYEYTDIRYADGSVALGSQPSLMAQPSVVAGKEFVTTRVFNQIGQLLSVTESGYRPVDQKGDASDLKVTAANPAFPITRTTTYSYQIINGRSLLVQMDGPLANGPKGDPTDSDITRFGWDALGHQLVSVNLPGGQIDQLSHEENSTRLSQITSTWGSQRTRKWNRYDPQGNVEAAGEDLLNEKLEVLSSRQVNQTRDAWNRISSVAWDGNQVESIAYGADGQPNTLRLGKDQPMQLVPATDPAQNAG
jgi:hypothetical protein